MKSRVYWAKSERVAVRGDTADPRRVKSQTDTVEKGRVPVKS